jgi:hypothetical protein
MGAFGGTICWPRAGESLERLRHMAWAEPDCGKARQPPDQSPERMAPMRVLIKVEFPVEAANAAIKAGSLPRTIQSILDEQKPEAAYFLASNGKRAGLLIVELADPSQIPALAEPWFLSFSATVDFQPVMVPADLAKAAPAIEKAVKKYG